MGNMSIFSPFVFYFIIYVIFVLNRQASVGKKGAEDTRMYTQADKRKALSAMATSLLLARDSDDIIKSHAYNDNKENQHFSNKQISIISNLRAIKEIESELAILAEICAAESDEEEEDGDDTTEAGGGVEVEGIYVRELP
jgi:hypothetical protein